MGSLFIFIVGALIASILCRGWEEAAAAERKRKNTQPAAAAAALEAQKTLEFQLIGYRRRRRRHRCRAKSCHVPPSDYIAKI